MKKKRTPDLSFDAVQDKPFGKAEYSVLGKSELTENRRLSSLAEIGCLTNIIRLFSLDSASIDD